MTAGQVSATSALVPLRLPARPWHLAALRLRPFHRAVVSALPPECYEAGPVPSL